MALKDLLNQSKAAAPKAGGKKGPKLVYIDMSAKGYTKSDGTVVPSNQGTISFFPILDITGREVKYAYNVYNGIYVSENENGDEYNIHLHYMDPKDYDMELTDDQKAKITKVRSLISYGVEHLDGFPWYEVNKNYALMFGYVIGHTSTDGSIITNKENRTMALLIFPSKNFAKAMNICASSIAQLGDENNLAEDTYNDLFHRDTTHRVFLEVTFKKGEGFGYDCAINYKAVDRYAANLLTPNEIKEGAVEIPHDLLDMTGSLSAVYFSGNKETADDFDEEMCNSYIEQTEAYIKSLEVEKEKAEALPPLPSKNKKKKSDLDE